MSDPVNLPEHYRAGSPYETLRVLEEWMTPEQFSGFLLGNSLKYLSRADLKGNAIEDLRKAAFYINREIQRRGGGEAA